jgi:hypothetical protein
VRQLATIKVLDGVRNQERGQPILIAHDPRRPLDRAWPELKAYT